MVLKREVLVENYEVENLSMSNIKKGKIFHITKRTIDIIGALLGLVIASPLFLVISLMYQFGKAKGPIFFKQIRIGLYGEKFYIYKFRSMVQDADEKLKNNDILYKKYLDNNYKLEPEEDPRITSIGRFLRRTSLDELPQLVNVLLGNMSLVGPRPVVEEELSEYGNKKNIFTSVKPGVTGHWQVCGRSNIGYPERIDVEIEYVFKQSVGFDLRILFKTLSIVLLKKGAY